MVSSTPRVRYNEIRLHGYGRMDMAVWIGVRTTHETLDCNTYATTSRDDAATHRLHRFCDI